MLRNDISQLFDQRELSVFRIKVAEEQQVGEFLFFRKRCQNPADPIFLQVRFQCLSEAHVTLQDKFWTPGELVEPCQHSLKVGRQRHEESYKLLLILHLDGSPCGWSK